MLEILEIAFSVLIGLGNTSSLSNSFTETGYWEPNWESPILLEETSLYSDDK